MYPSGSSAHPLAAIPIDEMEVPELFVLIKNEGKMSLEYTPNVLEVESIKFTLNHFPLFDFHSSERRNLL
jgi:hypothetical protein